MARKTAGSNNMVAIIAVVVVVAIILVALILFLLFKPGKGPSIMGADLANYYPQDTIFYAELNITPEKLKKLKELSGDSFSFQSIADGIKHAAKQPGETIQAMEIFNELNKTLEPQFAMGIWATEGSEEKPDNVVFASVVKNKDNVPQLMDKLTEGKANFAPENVDGQEFYVATDGKGGAYVVSGDILLFSDKVETLQLALNQAKSGKMNVLETKEAKNVLSNLPSEKILTALINISNISKVASKDPDLKTKDSLESKLQQVDNLTKTMAYTGVAVDLKDNVLIAKSFTPYALEELEDPALKEVLQKLGSVTNKLDSPTILPADTFMFMSISGLDQFFLLSVQMMDEKDQQMYQQQKQMVTMMTQLDVDTDVLPVISEELTIAASLKDKQPEPMVLLTSKDKSLQTLNKLAGSMAMMDPSTSITEESSSGTKLSVIQASGLPFKLAFGKVNDLIILGKKDSVKTAVEDASDASKSLAKNEIYKDLSKYIQTNPSFVLFVNANKLSEAADVLGKSKQQIENIKDMNKNMDGLIISVGSKDNKAITGNFVMKLKKAS